MLSFLTEDLLARIFGKLESDSDRKSWRLVCKDFLRVDLVHRRHIKVLRVELISSLLNRYMNIEHLDLSVCPRIDDATVSFLLSRDSVSWTRTLKRLVLSRATGLRPTGLEMLVRACPGLESVDVSHCWVFGDREASALSCAEGLREVKMDKCLNLTDVGLAKIAITCCRLERLSLKWCLDISDLGIDLLVKKCSHLKSLDISYLKVTNESLRSIASLNKLELLNVMGCSLLDDVGLEFLGNGCPSLQGIDVSRCDGISATGLISIVRAHGGLLWINASFCLPELSTTFLRWLKDLKSIRVDGAQVSDFSFQTLSTNSHALIEMGLSKCVGVTDKGIMQLVSGCVDLKILDLTCCDFITDAAISAVAESCRNLMCLRLESCGLITEKSLEQLGSCCLQLAELDLTDCCGVNDQGLYYLSRCSELSSLKLGLCSNISDKGLAHIASNCSKVCELDLYSCLGIGNDGLAALSIGCKNMKKLNLAYCNKVSDRGMKYIGLMEELSDLELRGLEGITSAGLIAVVSGCKRLADLDLKHCKSINDSGFWFLAFHSQNLRQINLSHCNVSDVGLCVVMGNLMRLQDAKLVNLSNVTVNGFELALRACSVRMKKVKLLADLRFLLSPEILRILKAGGCKIRWD